MATCMNGINVESGANEPLKVAMEHSTAIYMWVPLKYKFKSVQFPCKESA